MLRTVTAVKCSWFIVILSIVIIPYTTCLGQSKRNRNERGVADDVITKYSGTVTIKDFETANPNNPVKFDKLNERDLPRQLEVQGIVNNTPAVSSKVTDEVIRAKILAVESKKFWDILARTSNLQYLSLQDTRFTDDAFSEIETCKELVNLAVDGTEISDSSIAKFKLLPKLNYLSIQRCPMLTEKCIENLKEMQGLTELKLNGNSNKVFTAARIEELRQAMPKCKIVGTDGT